MLSVTQKSQQQSPSPNLFDLLYYFPNSEQQLKNYKKIDLDIKQIISTLRKLQKNHLDQIQKVCISNRKFISISKLLYDQKLSTITVNLFTHLLLSVKLLNYLIKINIPLIIYKNLIKLIEKEKGSSNKQKEIQQCFRFIYEYCKIDAKKFPRFYAHLFSGLLVQNIFNRSNYMDNQNRSINLNSSLILDISIEILKNNLQLAAETQILQNLFNKIIDCIIDIQKIKIIMEIITNYCNNQQSRIIILSTIDLGKCFLKFNNVDQGTNKGSYLSSQSFIGYQEIYKQYSKNCVIIQILLSSWSTLIYLIKQKFSLLNFFNGLVRKSQFQIQIIKQSILKKMINKILQYNKQKMKKSLNQFGYKSNYLNYRGLVLFNFLLKQNNLYQIFEVISKDDDLLQNLSKLCLDYFPNIFQNQKYNKRIIKNIKYSQHYQNFIIKEAYKKKLQSQQQVILINIKSFCNTPLLAFDFQLKELRNFLIFMKNDNKILCSLPEQLQEQMEIVLSEIKVQCQINNTDIDKAIKLQYKKKLNALLVNFYNVGIKAFQYIPWKPEYLKLSEFMSSILQYLINNKYKEIYPILIKTMKKIFQKEDSKVHLLLMVKVLDDFGKFFINHSQCQKILIQYFQNDAYAFRISRILLNIDYQKSNDYFYKNGYNYNFDQNQQILNPKRLLQFFCQCKNTSSYLILQIIEIIKKNCYQNTQKYQLQQNFLLQLIPNNLIYHKSQQVSTSCVEFLQQILMKNTSYDEKFIKSIKLQNIKNQHLKKRIAYLFLMFQQGINIVTQLFPYFFKEELQNWFVNNNKIIKDYSAFLLKQVKRFNNNYIKEKQTGLYQFLGFQQNQRRSLLNLPWNIKINDQSFSAVAEYKILKQKLKLRVRVSKYLSSQFTISLRNIGSYSFQKQVKLQNGNVQPNNIIKIRFQDIVRSYQRNKNKQNKQQQKFAIKKDLVTLFFRVQQNQTFILQKLTINIYLQKNIYRPLIYPHNFIQMLTMTKAGMDLIKKQKIIERSLQKIEQLNKKSQQFIKSQLIFLGCYCSSQIQSTESLMIYDTVMKTFIQTKNYQIKEICHWIINVMVKNDQFKKKIKQQKKWRIIQAKYCKSLVFYNYFNEASLRKQQQYNHLDYVRKQLPDKLQNETQFKQIYQFLNNQSKQFNINLNQNMKKKTFSNPKVFENIMKYMSIINYSTQKINIVLQIYKNYISSVKFENDFPNGFILN